MRVGMYIRMSAPKYIYIDRQRQYIVYVPRPGLLCATAVQAGHQGDAASEAAAASGSIMDLHM